MISSKQRFILVLAFLPFIFSNCEDNSSSTSVAEDKENISQLFDDVITEANNLKSGCGVQTVDKFMNIDNGSFVNSNWVETLYNALESHLNITVYQTSKFAFNNHTGTHTWNSSNNTWSHSTVPNNNIVLEFPSQMGNVSNNAIATATHYTDENVQYNGYQYWLPKTAFVGLKVDNEECISLDLKSATYDNTTYQIPTDMEFHLKLKPYVFEIKVNRKTPTKANVKLTAKRNGTTKFSFNTDITVKHSNYQNIVFWDDFIKATGTFTFGDFSMPFTADFETARSLFNPSDAQINTLFDADVFYKGNEIADIDYAKDINGYADIIVKYKDGTAEDTETYYNDFLDQLEIIVVEFTGAWPN